MSHSSQTPVQEHASAILAFAEELHNHLAQAGSPDKLALPDNVLDVLDQYLEQLPLFSGSVPVSSRRSLDARSVELWNRCMWLIAQGEGGVLGILSKVRAFAFAVLESAASSQEPGNSRALDVALKTARTCLENEQLDLCLRVLGMAAARLDALERSEVDADAIRIRALTTEYYMLRIHLSWLQGRPDIAEHLFSKVPEARSNEDEKNVLETCYRIGKQSLSDGHYDTSAKWLGRALDSSDSLSRQPDPALKDMRLLVLNAVVQANVHNVRTADSQEQFSRALYTLSTEYGNQFPALMIQLEILSNDERPDGGDYFKVLMTAIHAMRPTDANLNMIFYYIQKLNCWSVDLAAEAIKEILLERLGHSDQRTLTERCFVTIIWMLTSGDTCPQKIFDIVTDWAERLCETGQEPLSEEAAHASLILIWRSISIATSNGKFPDAERWCSLALEQPVFQNCSLANKTKFQRKLLASALENSNVSLSRRILDHMDEGSRSNPLALYLTYKLALLDGDYGLGSESLDKLRAVDKKHILSCAAETQRLGKTLQAIEIFQGVIANVDDRGESINVSGLMQSTIMLLSKELERCKKDAIAPKLLDEICGVFEAALKEAGKQELSPECSIFARDDCEWLFRSAYSLALESMGHSTMGNVSRLLDVSVKFATLYQNHLKPEENTDIHSHYLLCDFLKTLELVPEARKQSDSAEKTTHYQAIQATIQSFRARIPSQLGNKNNTAKERNEWTARYRTMLAFDFEAAIHLKQWPSLPDLIEESKPIVTDKLCSIFLESILSSDAPIRVILRVVKTIICTNHKTIPTKLPRYLHILFQLALSPPEPDTTTSGTTRSTISIAESVLDQVLALARNSNSKSKAGNRCYPDDELEWLATTAFNRAVDFYRDSEDAECLRWAGKAIEVAELVRAETGGLLVGLLRRNLGGLGLGSP